MTNGRSGERPLVVGGLTGIAPDRPGPYPVLRAVDGAAPAFGVLPFLLSGAPGSSVQLELEQPDGSSELLDVERLRPEPIPSEGVSWLTSIELGDLGYLHPATFAHRDLPTLDHTAMIGQLDRALSELSHCRGLILDLRYNAGGDAYVAQALAARLLHRDELFGVLHERRYGFLDRRTELVVEPVEHAYAGMVVVLVNAFTASSAEHLVLTLQRARRALVIGERTAGAEAALTRFQTPDGTTVVFGSRRITEPDGSGIQGVGLEPDRVVELTIDDVRRRGFEIARDEAEDAQFQAALRALGSSRRWPPLQRSPLWSGVVSLEVPTRAVPGRAVSER